MKLKFSIQYGTQWGESLHVVLCYGSADGTERTANLLSHLPQTCFLEHPKWLIAHGNITILLHASVCNRVIGIHGPMAFQMAGERGLATGITRDILFGTLPQYEVRHSPYDQSGRVEGILVGGNLSSYSAITGTSFQLPPKHDVIFSSRRQRNRCTISTDCSTGCACNLTLSA